MDRTKILQRIANLRARAEDDASSENEAMVAAAKAADLMEAYNVAEAELAVAETEGRVQIEIVSEQVASKNGKQDHRAISCATGIASLTTTKVINLRRTGKVEFTGHRPDVETATYLFELIRNALDREYASWSLRQGPGVGRGAKASFQLGMVNRINIRLAQMAREQREARESAAERVEREAPQIARSQSTELVIVDVLKEKVEKTEQAFREKYPKTRTTYSSRRAGNGSAYGAGYAAGGRIGLNRGVGQSRQKALT